LLADLDVATTINSLLAEQATLGAYLQAELRAPRVGARGQSGTPWSLPMVPVRFASATVLRRVRG